jgi:hypothetical protein
MPRYLDRSKDVSRKKTLNQEDSSTAQWDQAIADAKRRIADLRFTIKVFEARKRKGERWKDSVLTCK